MNGLLESMEVLLTILLAFGFGIGSGYAVISAILYAFRPRLRAQALPLETVGATRQ
jgi:hypothetical protein